LEEEGIVRALEVVLENYYDVDVGTEVLYWEFRCLVTLICDYGDGSSSSSPGGGNDDIDVDEEFEDFNASRKYRTDIANSKMIEMAWESISSSAAVNPTTLEMAFKFLSYFEIESYIADSEDSFVMEVCEQAILAKPHASYPVLHHLTCAFLCLAVKADSFDRKGWMTKSIFLNVALNVLSLDRDNDANSLSSSSTSNHSLPNASDVMICTLSHLLCYGHVNLGLSESNTTLKICSTILEDDESSDFQRGSCIWIIWFMFNHGLGLGTTYASKAAEGIQHALKKLGKDPALLAVAFSALSQVVAYIHVKAEPLIKKTVRLVSNYSEAIAHVTSSYSDVKTMCAEACHLLCRLCKTREIALFIATSGWLQLSKTPWERFSSEGDSSTSSCDPCPVDAHLMIKLSVMLVDDDDALSIEDHEAMIDASVQLKDVSPLAAKSWLGFLAVSITPDKEDFKQSSSMAVISMIEILEAYPKNINMQKMALMALRNMAVSIQEAGVPLDISTCIRLALDAQKEHGVQIYDECCGALWALMGVKCDLESMLLREVVYFAIEVTEVHILSSGYPFNEGIVSAGMAIFANTFSNPVNVMEVLGEKIIDIVVDVVNTTIYECLNKRENHPLIFELGFRTLSRLSTDDSCRDVIVNHGGIVAVVDGMMENLESAIIQENGCNILRRLGGNDLEMKLKIVEADGVDAIMNIMISHGEKANVLSEAFQALSCLSVDKTSRNFIAQQGGVMVIANSMKMLADSVELQETGLAALCNIASDVEEDILESSDIYAVVNDSLERHANEAAIQRQGLALLYNLSVRSGGMSSKLMSNGCLRNIIKAVENHRKNPKVLSPALSMLINLSDTEECCKALVEEKTINLITNAITLNVENLKIAIVGCNILSVMCQKSTNKRKIGFGGIEAVVYAMMVHYSSEYVQDLGCGILSRCSSHSFMSSRSLLDIGMFVLLAPCCL